MAEDVGADDTITISIGTEHEFLARPKDPASTVKPSLHDVANAINSACIPGIKAVVSTDIRRSNVWRVTDDCSIAVGPKPAWNREPTIDEQEMNDANHETHADIEIISTAFAVGSRNGAGRMKPEWEIAIPAVIAVLQDNFRLYVNESMGTHIHMGTGLNNPQPLEFVEVQKLSIFVVVNERVLDTLFPSHRRGTASDWCRSNLKNMYFGGKTIEEIVRDIAEAPSLDVLVRMMCPRLEKDEQTGKYSMPLRPGSTHPAHSEKRYKLNLHNLRSRYPPYTIEWRQCEGTVDVKKVCKCIRLIIAIRRLLASMTLDEVREKYGDPKTAPRFWDVDALYHAWHDDVAL